MSLQDRFKYAISNDIFMDAALLNIPGISIQRKFFENPDLVAGVLAELWDYGGTEEAYTYTAEVGADYYIFSSDATDNQMAEVTVQDEDGYEYVVLVQMAGKTPVKVNDLDNAFALLSINTRITDYKCTRCYRFENEGATDFAGMVYVTEGNAVTDGVPDDTTKVRASVNNGNNKTLMCQYRIPVGKVGLFYWSFISITRKVATIAEVSLWSKDIGGVEKIQDKININTVGTTSIERLLKVPQIVSARNDFTIKGIVDADCGIAGSYQIVVVDEEFAVQALAIMKNGGHVK